MAFKSDLVYQSRQFILNFAIHICCSSCILSKQDGRKNEKPGKAICYFLEWWSWRGFSEHNLNHFRRSLLNLGATTDPHIKALPLIFPKELTNLHGEARPHPRPCPQSHTPHDHTPHGHTPKSFRRCSSVQARPCPCALCSWTALIYLITDISSYW